YRALAPGHHTARATHMNRADTSRADHPLSYMDTVTVAVMVGDRAARTRLGSVGLRVACIAEPLHHSDTLPPLIGWHGHEPLQLVIRDGVGIGQAPAHQGGERERDQNEQETSS